MPLRPQILITANNGNKRKWKNTISTASSRLIFLDSRPGSLTCYCSLDINLCAALRHWGPCFCCGSYNRVSAAKGSYVALQRQVHANLGALDCASFAEATFDTHDKSLAPHLHPLHSLNATARRRRSTPELVSKLSTWICPVSCNRVS